MTGKSAGLLAIGLQHRTQPKRRQQLQQELIGYSGQQVVSF